MLNDNLPWIEKYRPKTLLDISSQESTIQCLQNSIDSHNIPHLILYGPEGTGKTSTILAICRNLYGDKYKDYVLELNASDERGINVVRSKIKNFVQNKTALFNNLPCYKIIILDEADSLTKDAQSALRRMIEDHSKITRFCFICNHLSKIIEPLISRCLIFRFKSLSQNSIIQRLKYICNNEDIEYTDELGYILTNISNGDLRKAINLLQSLKKNVGLITHNLIEDITGQLPDKLFYELIDRCLDRDFNGMRMIINDIIANAYLASIVINKFYNYILNEQSKLNQKHKIKIIKKISEIDKLISDGSNETIQLLNLFSYFISILN
jgi:replication factor C subunit 2/4